MATAYTDSLPSWFGHFVDTPPTVFAPGKINGYRVLGEVGRGGMGIVFEAQQEHPARRVAIKVAFRPTGATQQMLRGEANMLARLSHGCIASIYDAGMAKNGEPFLVMEFVDGKPLTEYAAERPLRERLDLFAEITNAVAYAHSRGIIHRDLKPSNILVEPDGTPKVLDFGLAQVAESRRPERRASIAGTTPYLSPEQLTGEDAGTLTDVYSLGVILYHLITGQHPYGEHSWSRPSLVEAVAAGPPPSPKQFAKVSTDLSAICLKALERDPVDRYQTARELAVDLERCLMNRPVAARQPTAWYQVWRFLARHRFASVAGLVAFVLLLAFAAWVYTEPNRRLLAFSDRLDALALTARGTGDWESAVGLYGESLSIKGGVLALDHPRIGSAHLNLARALRTTGDTSSAQRHLQLALRNLPAQHPDAAVCYMELAALHFFRARYAAAIRAAEKALELLDTHPDGVRFKVRALQTIAGCYRDLGDFESSERYARSALTISQDHFGLHNAYTAGSSMMLSHIMYERGNLAEALELLESTTGDHIEGSTLASDYLSRIGGMRWAHGDYESAIDLITRSMSMERERGLHDDFRESSRLNQLGVCLRDSGRIVEAEPLLHRALAIAKRVYGDGHRNTGNVIVNLARLEYLRGQFERAIELANRSLTIRRRELSPSHLDVAESLLVIGASLTAQGELSEAKPLLLEAIRIRALELPTDDRLIVEVQSALAEWHIRSCELGEAGTLLDTILPILESKLNHGHKLIRQARSRVALLNAARTSCAF